MAYPYSELNTKEIIDFEERVTNILRLAHIFGKPERTRNSEAIIVGLQHLKSKHGVNFNDKIFLDCLSVNGDMLFCLLLSI